MSEVVEIPVRVVPNKLVHGPFTAFSGPRKTDAIQPPNPAEVLARLYMRSMGGTPVTPPQPTFKGKVRKLWQNLKNTTS